MKRRISVDGEHLNLFPIDYGATNRPNSQRRERQRQQGGYPPSRPCPPGVDPETGEIKAESLYSQVANELLGKRLPPSRLKYREQHPPRLGKSAWGVQYGLLPQGELGKVGRLVAIGVLLALAVLVVRAYEPPPAREIPSYTPEQIESQEKTRWQEYWDNAR